jgi:hypothetical protein
MNLWNYTVKLAGLAARVAAPRREGAVFFMPPREIEAEFGRRRIAFFGAPGGVRTEIMEIIEDSGLA